MSASTSERANPMGYVVALSTPPAIQCPSWCSYSQEEHVEDLHNWEGRALHRGTHVLAGLDILDSDETELQVAITSETMAGDGTPDPTSQTRLNIEGGNLTIDGAEQYAKAILEAVEKARLSQAQAKTDGGLP